MKLQMPMMSGQAHGELTQRVVYSQRKSGAQCRVQKAQKGKRSSGQNNQNVLWQIGVSYWKALSQASKDVYNDYVKDHSLPYSGFCYFMEVFLNTPNLSLKKIYSATSYTDDMSAGLQFNGIGGCVTINNEVYATNNLEEVHVASWSLDGSFDFSGLTQLTTALLNDNSLIGLNFAGCSALTTFASQNNDLTSVDLSGCSSLVSLSLAYNILTSIDLTGLTSLSILLINNNPLATIDISPCTALQVFHVNNCLLTSLTIPALNLLYYVKCDNNILTSLNLSSIPAIKFLYANVNAISDTDIIFNSVNQAQSNGKLYTQGGTNAPVTGASLTARNALVAKGWDLQYN